MSDPLSADRLQPPTPGQLRRLMGAERLRPRKSLSQNFLTDPEALDAIVEGAANLGYRLAYNTLLDGQHLAAPAVDLVAPEMDDRAGLQRLARALERGDGEGARAAARSLLEAAAA